MKRIRYPSSLLAKAALLTATALIFSYVEMLVPVSVGIPGVKLGLANIVIVFALYTLGFRYAFLISICRAFLSALLFGSIFSVLYSLAGAVLSLIIMSLLRKTGLFSIAAVSAAGGVFHNLGQIIIAAFVVRTPQMMLYFPVLVFSGIAAGTVNGILTVLCMRRFFPDSADRAVSAQSRAE